MVVDPIINAIAGSLADAFAGSIPARQPIWALRRCGGCGDQHHRPRIGWGGFAAVGGGHAATTASSPDAAAMFNKLIYQPFYALEQDWITSSFGTEVDGSINSGFGEFLIGNGANGIGRRDIGRRGRWYRRVVVR